MSPFIKITRVEQQAGPHDRTALVYVNVDHVAKATYTTNDDCLELLVSIPGYGTGSENIKLYGGEAKAALETLKNLP